VPQRSSPETGLDAERFADRVSTALEVTVSLRYGWLRDRLASGGVGRGDTACWRAKEPDHPCELFGHNDVGLGGGQDLIHVLVGDARRQRSESVNLGHTEIRADGQLSGDADGFRGGYGSAGRPSRPRRKQRSQRPRCPNLAQDYG
jgi:hypothetical protein